MLRAFFKLRYNFPQTHATHASYLSVLHHTFTSSYSAHCAVLLFIGLSVFLRSYQSRPSCGPGCQQPFSDSLLKRRLRREPVPGSLSSINEQPQRLLIAEPESRRTTCSSLYGELEKFSAVTAREANYSIPRRQPAFARLELTELRFNQSSRQVPQRSTFCPPRNRAPFVTASILDFETYALNSQISNSLHELNCDRINCRDTHNFWV
jgi:hypothetical protein